MHYNSARPSRAIIAALALLLLLSPGCLVRRLRVIRPGVAKNARLQDATLENLVAGLQSRDQQVRTITITADMEPSLGSVQKGEIKEFQDVRGFILIRKPNDIRMIGLYPVVRTRAFDMVSNGTTFGLYVPVKNKFIVGRNQVTELSPNKIENLRPAHIFEALMVQPPHDGERPVLENDTDELHASYIIHMVKENNGRLFLYRNVWFDRVSLRVQRQEIFDEAGDIVSDTRYDDYDNVHGIPYPKKIAIMRPRDEYGVKLDIKKVELNTALTDDKFALQQPPGTELLDLSQPRENRGGAAPVKPEGGSD